MKRSAKFFLTVVVMVTVIAIILLIPPVTAKVSAWTGIAASKINTVAVTVVGTGVGLILIYFGVAALGALPIVGVGLIIAVVAVLAHSLWPVCRSNTITASNGGLNSMTA